MEGLDVVHGERVEGVLVGEGDEVVDLLESLLGLPLEEVIAQGNLVESWNLLVVAKSKDVRANIDHLANLSG